MCSLGLWWQEIAVRTEKLLEQKVNGVEPVRTFACFHTGSLTPHSAVSLALAEFDIWYNESFIIPDDVQVALKLGSSIRPGMVPVNRIVCLVSSTRVRGCG